MTYKVDRRKHIWVSIIIMQRISNINMPKGDVLLSKIAIYYKSLFVYCDLWLTNISSILSQGKSYWHRWWARKDKSRLLHKIACRWAARPHISDRWPEQATVECSKLVEERKHRRLQVCCHQTKARKGCKFCHNVASLILKVKEPGWHLGPGLSCSSILLFRS
jgi:hypothetical protein